MCASRGTSSGWAVGRQHSGRAEEVMFRAYLFGRLRAGRGFWAAATLAMAALTAVHLLLFSG